MTNTSSGHYDKERAESGWSDDVDERRARRPTQRIDPEDRSERGGGLVLTPAWVYACEECGYETRIATEATITTTDCRGCGEITDYKPLGTLEYP
jgi:hypothetical protein